MFFACIGPFAVLLIPTQGFGQEDFSLITFSYFSHQPAMCVRGVCVCVCVCVYVCVCVCVCPRARYEAVVCTYKAGKREVERERESNMLIYSSCLPYFAQQSRFCAVILKR